MKAHSQELVDKSLATMLSAIEIYNKPDFKYREEIFSILAINSWELLVKAKWIKDNNNKLSSIYVMEKRLKVDKNYYKKLKVKQTQCGNPITHGLDFFTQRLTDTKHMHSSVQKNIKVLSEIRDSAIHFYNKSNTLNIRLQEIGCACVMNYVNLSRDWFNVDLAKYNFYLMPIAFILPDKVTSITLNRQEANLVNFIASLAPASNDALGDYAVSVNIELKFIKSKDSGAASVQNTNDPNAAKVQFVEADMLGKYPFQHSDIREAYKQKYSNKIPHKTLLVEIRKFKSDPKFTYTRYLNPKNRNGGSKTFYSQTVFSQLDKLYESMV